MESLQDKKEPEERFSAEITRMIDGLGLGDVDVSEMFGVSIETVVRWKQGIAVPQPRAKSFVLAKLNMLAEARDLSDEEAPRVLESNSVTIMEDTATPAAILERLVGLGKIELPAKIGGAAVHRDTTEGMTAEEIQKYLSLGAVQMGWGGLAIPINRIESQL
jgi:hypothetical protein